MTDPEIVMKFKLGQPTEVSVNGVKGQACHAFAKPFEDLLGGRLVSSTPTNEADEAVVTVDAPSVTANAGGVVQQ